MTTQLDVSLDVGRCTLALTRCGACCGSGDGVVCLGWAPSPKVLLQSVRVLTLSMRHGMSELVLSFTHAPLLDLCFAGHVSYTRGNLVADLHEHRGTVHAVLYWGDGDELTPETIVRYLVANSVEEHEDDVCLPTATLQDWFSGN